MRHHDLLRNIRTAGFERDNGFTQCPGNCHRLLEQGGLIDCFQVQADGRYPILLGKYPYCIVDIKLQTVSQGSHVRNLQAAFLHREVKADVG